jgi:opacity protein-like surface antigen
MAIVVLAIVVISGVVVVPASAESEKSYMATVLIGYSQMSETAAKLEVTGSHSETKVDPDGSVLIGAGIYFKAMPRLAIGGEACWLDLGKTGSQADQEHKLSTIPLTAQVAYFVPTQHSVTPFVTVGAGLYQTRYEGQFDGMSTTITGNNFGFNFGGGIKLAIDQGLGLGFDFRFHMAVDPTLEKSVAQGDIRADMDSWQMFTFSGRLFAF